MERQEDWRNPSACRFGTSCHTVYGGCVGSCGRIEPEACYLFGGRGRCRRGAFRPDRFGIQFGREEDSPSRRASVSISVDGKAIELPNTPVRSTNANGITDYKTYEVVYVLPSEISRLPKVSASSDNKDVKVEVKQARPDA